MAVYGGRRAERARTGAWAVYRTEGDLMDLPYGARNRGAMMARPCLLVSYVPEPLRGC